MSKMKLSFRSAQDGEALTIDWPVKIKWPESVGRNQRTGKVNGRHTEKTFFLTYAVLPDSDVDDLLKKLQDHNTKIAEAKTQVAAAKTDTEKDEAAEASKTAEEGFKAWREELLRRVVVGFPEAHGWDAVFEDLPEFSPDLVASMADFRFIGKAMEDAYWEIVNGGK